MTIHDWTSKAAKQLRAEGIASSRLDAELILSHTLRKSRTWLHMYRDEELSERHREIANARVQLRLDRVPLAYIIGHKEFYGRRFFVSPAVLIPRPESEAIIDALKELIDTQKSYTCVDVGTGSGCLGITAKLEFPNLDVTLLDISRYALAVAQKNADMLNATVHIDTSNLLAHYPIQPDIIIANLPYVDESWGRSPETNHEPAEALFADDHGLSLIKRLIIQAAGVQSAGSLLLLEADPEQHDEIRTHCLEHGYVLVETRSYCVVYRRA